MGSSILRVMAAPGRSTWPSTTSRGSSGGNSSRLLLDIVLVAEPENSKIWFKL